MNIPIQVELLNPELPSIVRPTELVIYLPDELPNTPTVTVAIEAKSYEPELRRRCTIYREVDLPTSAVAACFTMQNLKVKIVPEAAEALLASFNYKIVAPIQS